ncbi:hypothetical protein KCG43_15750 [Photobacterium sp. WH24]|nr:MULTISPECIES: DUF6559 family protein [Photobacterium]MBV7263457.1 hypothetical protein [Photobacterium sp. WH24]
MELIRKFKKRRAIKSYIKKLPSMLKRDYRKSKRYTPKQVKSTIERGGLSVVYACYGIAMFSNRKDFDQFHQEIGENCDYDAMRCEIGDIYFNGSSDFSVSDITSASSDSGGGIDAGGFSGGDSGGGGGD